MAAFAVAPIAGMGTGADSEAFDAMAGAIAVVAMLIVGTGISTNIVELRTRRESQSRLRHIALHDALTQLPNRRHFNEKLQSLCEGLSTGSGRPFALLMIDLDRFKKINDTQGHPVGDLVLARVAKRLTHAVRDSDLVARIGGDEFAVIMPGTDDAAEVGKLAERIVEVLSRPFAIDGNVSEIGGSVGIVLAPEHGRKAEVLTQHVDVALYSAKHEGKGRHYFFEPSLIVELQSRRQLETELRRACMRDEFEVVYQPIMNITSGGYIGAEALVRWQSESHGDISPEVFIPLAEELGLISRIGNAVLRRACSDASRWPSDLTVSVNVSPVQLMDPRLAQTVAQALEETGLSAHRLELEITETALLGNAEKALSTLSRLRELGVRISLDDFGTGYSSLTYLHKFPIDRIKIDRSFIDKLPSDAGSASIVRAITQLGGSLNLSITAEGIETDEQLSFISGQGCDHVQGYLFSRPLKRERAAALFNSRDSQTAAA
ncbi:bifunctional diguanylate cyclase/phosphodiesterase [Erythrobacter sp. AP23]|uniref:putative bifunctional diguanylate cyclase/phosphodiesterase n=1 Tax=Erythrobacter sp. AP23 TaxID=499656 RepID=UPI001F390286|nr:EAL domain-containing protein [Erythrobacter sp. AP23]